MQFLCLHSQKTPYYVKGISYIYFAGNTQNYIFFTDFSFYITRRETKKCMYYSVLHEQADRSHTRHYKLFDSYMQIPNG